MNHIIDLTDLTKNKWEEIISLACDIYDNPSNYANICNNKILATLFYEPSTRTQMSFQSAMLRLGGSVIGFDNPQNSSVSKGENLADTIRAVSNYADVLVMRHPVEGSALVGGLYTDKIFLNAGDGGHLHPTQTLTDLVTIKKEIGNFDNLTIGVCGDLKHGRTVHSLISLMIHYDNINFVLISTKELALPKKFKKMIDNSNCKYTEVHSIEEAIADLDVLYMTRIQRERFASDKLYEEQKNIYVLDMPKLSKSKPTLKVLHPLPRVDEISMEIDNDSRACYFRQAEYGMYARMALIMTLFNEEKEFCKLKGEDIGHICLNNNCVTKFESYLRESFVKLDEHHYCEYCGDMLVE